MAATATSPDVPLFDLRLEDEDLEAVAAAVRGGHLSGGEPVEEFERRFAAHLGCEHAVAVSSCTAALHLAYAAAGVGHGDEVIVPAFTFVATANAAIYCGARPVFADIVGPGEPAIDPEHVAQLIGPRTKAVAAVHFGGYAARAGELAALCEERGVALIEDTAHAPAASLDGRALGTFGLAGCFSFFSNKVLSAGEGGLVATDDAHVAEFARAHRVPRGEGAGWDYRMTGIAAALLGSRLGRLEADIERRRELVHRYRARLAGRPGLSIPYRDDEVDRSSCYVMPVMLDDGERRPEVRRLLREEHGVQTSILYPATHEFTAYEERFPGISLPRTEDASRRELTLPLFPHMTDAQHEQVVTGLAEALGR